MGDENEDVYSDLTVEAETENDVELQEQLELQQNHIKSLENDIEKLCAKILEMKKIQQNLTKNISELYKTAKAEIDRKDKTINELRSRLEQKKFTPRNNTVFNKPATTNPGSNGNKRERDAHSIVDTEADSKKIRIDHNSDNASNNHILESGSHLKSGSRENYNGRRENCYSSRRKFYNESNRYSWRR